jgi:3',5'-cyclic AMP phosphodiesterase CpdA
LRIIAHISDLHFGKADPVIVSALTQAVTAAKPDLVAVSGDLTQRARSRQFAAARAFLDTLPRPQIAVPGNHDVPLYNILKRFGWPLRNFRRYINEDTEPFFADGEIAVLGINSARSLTFKDGRINAAQVAKACRCFGRHPGVATRILVIHHPFDAPDPDHEKDIIGRAGMAMREFSRSGVDLILTGHLHVGGTSSSASRYQVTGSAALFVQAGTATSIRRRGEANGWNLIRTEREAITVDRMVWDPGQGSFVLRTSEHFTRAAEGWVAAGA